MATHAYTILRPHEIAQWKEQAYANRWASKLRAMEALGCFVELAYEGYGAGIPVELCGGHKDWYYLIWEGSSHGKEGALESAKDNLRRLVEHLRMEHRAKELLASRWTRTH